MLGRWFFLWYRVDAAAKSSLMSSFCRRKISFTSCHLFLLRLAAAAQHDIDNSALFSIQKLSKKSRVVETAKMATHESSFAARSHFRHFTAYCLTLMCRINVAFENKLPASRVHPRCDNAHNCLGPTLERWWNTEVSFNIQSSASPHLMDPSGLKVTQTTYFLH